MDKEKFRERNNLIEVTRKLDRDLDAIIVEGFSDRKVMKKLGFEGKIFLSAERNNELLAEDVERGADTVAVLTDFDSHGKKQNREIRQELQDKVDVIRASRKEFGAQLTSTGRRAIEDVEPLFHSKEDKFVDAALDRLVSVE
ncbi:MAG: 5S rRNA maturation endonuclease (ribonuclease M5) [Candidatus Nanohaloarchaea archaeon]|jgi:5S rRNA maturation endonuclease (ribonuclease M5)